MPLFEGLQSQTQIETRSVGKDHSEIVVLVCINRQLYDVDFLLLQRTLNGRANLPFVHYDELRILDAPTRESMPEGVPSDSRRLRSIHLCTY